MSKVAGPLEITRKCRLGLRSSEAKTGPVGCNFVTRTGTQDRAWREGHKMNKTSRPEGGGGLSRRAGTRLPEETTGTPIWKGSRVSWPSSLIQDVCLRRARWAHLNGAGRNHHHRHRLLVIVILIPQDQPGEYPSQPKKESQRLSGHTLAASPGTTAGILYDLAKLKWELKFPK